MAGLQLLLPLHRLRRLGWLDLDHRMGLRVGKDETSGCECPFPRPKKGTHAMLHDEEAAAAGGVIGPARDFEARLIVVR